VFQCFKFQFLGDLELRFGGLSPPKPSCGDGTDMTVTFSQLIWNIVGCEILFRLRKCQRKNSLPVRKNILELKYRTLKLKFSDVPLGEFWICIEEVYKRISKVVVEILLQFCTLLTCVKKVSHLCYCS